LPQGLKTQPLEQKGKNDQAQTQRGQDPIDDFFHVIDFSEKGSSQFT
jgi:hypothetical protein